MAMKIIKVTDIKDFKIGNAENTEKGTGCTVIVCEEGAVGGVDVRGGAPATRETDLLRSENTVSSVNAVVMSGGSAFGLEAGSGVMRELAERKVGFDVGDNIVVPIVCGASLYDLPIGDPTAFPDVYMGAQAVRNAYEGIFSNGNHGAGTGASVGKLKGYDRAMKAGLGTFACGDGVLEVGAIAAVNAVGDIYNGAGNIIAGLRSEDGKSIYGTIKTLKSMVHDQVRQVDDSTLFINKSDIEQALAAAARQYEEEAAAGESAEAPAEEEITAAPVAEPVEKPAAAFVFETPADMAEEFVAEPAVQEPEEPAEEMAEEPVEEIFEAPEEEFIPEAPEDEPVVEGQLEEFAPEVPEVEPEPELEIITEAEPVEEPAEEPVEEIIEEPAEEVILETPAELVVEEFVAEPAVQEPEVPAEEIAEEPVEEIFEAPEEEYIPETPEEEPVVETVEETAEEPAVEFIGEPEEEFIPETPETDSNESFFEEYDEISIPAEPEFFEEPVVEFAEEPAVEPVEETAEEPEEEYIPETPEDEPVVLSREDMGYDITFNTTISCLITNAQLTKSQANKLASILHDAYARAIKPVHGTLDGDTVFVLSTGKLPVNFDAFAALATDIMQYAIIDGAISAESAYGLPAARDM